MKHFLIVLSVALLTTLPTKQSAASPPDPSQAERVTIYRDAFGVPHVYGETDADAAFGFAYAQAEDNFQVLETNFANAIGRSAELIGQEGLLQDWVNFSLGIPELAKADYENSPPETRALADAYAAGVNYFLATNPDIKPRLIDQFEPWYSFALIRYIYFQGGFMRAAGLKNQDLLKAFKTLNPDAAQEVLQKQAALFPPSDALEILPTQGSNSWAVSPEKSASGNALLFINPHLPFFGPSQVYEGHVISGQGWNFSGYTRIGFPLPYVGFNDKLGWASTDNQADLADLYRETFDDPANPMAYQVGDKYRAAAIRTAALKVRDGNNIRAVEVRSLETHHGPILGVRNEDLISLRMAKFESHGWLDQWYKMTKAKTYEQFLAAASKLDMLFGNYLYADATGNIFFVYNGAVPIRDESFDWQNPVEGSDPETDWKGYHPISEIPQLLNPAGGFLQNCNSTPFLATSEGNLNPADYPSYMVRESDNLRGENARRILMSNDRFTFAEWEKQSFSTYSLHAAQLVPFLVDEWRRFADDKPEFMARTAPAMDLLGAWDYIATIESVEMSVYYAWNRAYFIEKGQGLTRESEPEEIFKALVKALSYLEQGWGVWQVPWGQLSRLAKPADGKVESVTSHDPSYAIPGIPGWAGGSFTFYTVRDSGRGLEEDPLKPVYGIHGNSYVAIVEFGETVTAKSIHTFGASGDPASPHYFDQAALYARGEYKPAWIFLEDVKEHASEGYHPGERQ